MLEPFRIADDGSLDRVVRAEVLAQLATALVFSGDLDEAGPLFDEALTTLEEQEAWPALADALVGHAIYLGHRHRYAQSVGVLRLAASLAEEHDLPRVALRARYNLAAAALRSDRLADALDEVREGLGLARERGDRAWESMLQQQAVAPMVALGRWDEAEPVATAMLDGESSLDALFAAAFLVQIAAARGDEDAFERCQSIAETEHDSSYVDLRSAAAVVLARRELERGAHDAALRLARPVLGDVSSTAPEVVEEAYALCIEAAFAVGDEPAMSELATYADALPPVQVTPLLRAGRARLSAELAQRRGDARAAGQFEDEAIGLLRSVGARPLLARTLLERARRREDAEAVAEARSIFNELGATRWLAEIDQASGVAA